MAVPQKIKNRVTIRPNNPFSGNLPEKLEHLFAKTCAPLCSLQHYHHGPDMDTTEVSSDRGLHKEGVAHIYSALEYYSATRKDEKLPFATTRMDLGNIMLSEISQKKLTI